MSLIGTSRKYAELPQGYAYRTICLAFRNHAAKQTSAPLLGPMFGPHL